MGPARFLCAIQHKIFFFFSFHLILIIFWFLAVRKLKFIFFVVGNITYAWCRIRTCARYYLIASWVQRFRPLSQSCFAHRRARTGVHTLKRRSTNWARRTSDWYAISKPESRMWYTKPASPNSIQTRWYAVLRRAKKHAPESNPVHLLIFKRMRSKTQEYSRDTTHAVALLLVF